MAAQRALLFVNELARDSAATVGQSRVRSPTRVSPVARSVNVMNRGRRPARRSMHDTAFILRVFLRLWRWESDRDCRRGRNAGGGNDIPDGVGLDAEAIERVDRASIRHANGGERDNATWVGRQYNRDRRAIATIRNAPLRRRT
jgi:hypothetical protein